MISFKTHILDWTGYIKTLNVQV